MLLQQTSLHRDILPCLIQPDPQLELEQCSNINHNGNNKPEISVQYKAPEACIGMGPSRKHGTGAKFEVSSLVLVLAESKQMGWLQFTVFLQSCEIHSLTYCCVWEHHGRNILCMGILDAGKWTTNAARFTCAPKPASPTATGLRGPLFHSMVPLRSGCLVLHDSRTFLLKTWDLTPGKMLNDFWPLEPKLSWQN